MGDLVSRLADDEQSAWAEFYDATAEVLFHYVTVLVGNTDAAAEVFQESFVRLYQSRGRLRDVEDLKAFAFIVVRNETHRWLKRHFTLLKNLNEELFRDTSKKTIQVDGDRASLDDFRRDPGRDHYELACVTGGRGAAGAIT